MLSSYWDLWFLFADFGISANRSTVWDIFEISCVMQERCGRSLIHLSQFRFSKCSGWTREEVFSLFCSKQASKTSVMSRLSDQWPSSNTVFLPRPGERPRSDCLIARSLPVFFLSIPSRFRRYVCLCERQI